MSSLSSASYGKDNVRVLKVRRDPNDPKKQEVIELTVCVLLSGDIEEAWTKADNSPIVPTDTVKNTIYILAKQCDVWPIEQFGAELCEHFVNKYSHIHGAEATITQHKWSRYNVDGKPHPHAFVKDGDDIRVCTVKTDDVRGSGFVIQSGMKNLTVLKSTGSMFYGFHECDFTTLKETWDRILSTDVDALWNWDPSKTRTLKQIVSMGRRGVFDTIWEKAKRITLDTFATENSASVQATMYNMSQAILNAESHVNSVTYALPNKHYFEIDLSWHHNLANTGKDAEVYAPQSNPNGLIKSTVSRPKAKL